MPREFEDRAIALFPQHLLEGTAVVWPQVLQEYFAAATRKLKLAPEMAQPKVEDERKLAEPERPISQAIIASEDARIASMSSGETVVA